MSLLRRKEGDISRLSMMHSLCRLQWLPNAQRRHDCTSAVTRDAWRRCQGATLAALRSLHCLQRSKPGSISPLLETRRAFIAGQKIVRSLKCCEPEFRSGTMLTAGSTPAHHPGTAPDSGLCCLSDKLGFKEYGGGQGACILTFTYIYLPTKS